MVHNGITYTLLKSHTRKNPRGTPLNGHCWGNTSDGDGDFGWFWPIILTWPMKRCARFLGGLKSSTQHPQQNHTKPMFQTCFLGPFMFSWTFRNFPFGFVKLDISQPRHWVAAEIWPSQEPLVGFFGIKHLTKMDIRMDQTLNHMNIQCGPCIWFFFGQHNTIGQKTQINICVS